LAEQAARQRRDSRASLRTRSHPADAAALGSRVWVDGAYARFCLFGRQRPVGRSAWSANGR